MRRGEMIRVLGPVDLASAGGVTTIGSRNLRAVLAGLVVGVGHAVPADRLQYCVWGDDPPKSADNTLQSYVSRLRSMLGRDAILSEDHSYQLVVDADQLDAVTFERLLVEATATRSDPERCEALCREALGLWRGQPFGELADDEAFHLEAQRLDELRISTMELSLEAELALGRHELVVGELESAVEEYPYRERLWYLLIEGLERDGRRVEAMRACAALRKVLAEVGLEAAPRLDELEARILAS